MKLNKVRKPAEEKVIIILNRLKLQTLSSMFLLFQEFNHGFIYYKEFKSYKAHYILKIQK